MNDPDRRLIREGATLALDGHVLDLGADLLQDTSVRVTTMRPQAWAVLRLLALNAGRVVTKDQMLAEVWPGLVVTDGSLAQAVSDVRQALGEAGHRIVKTVPRRGYLLVLDVAGAARAPAGDHRHPSLPHRADALFGRAPELELLQRLLEQHRLVTVVGAGGIGKTVIALDAAHGQSLADGAIWVELAPIADAALLAPKLAQALGLPIERDVDPLPGLLAALKPLDVLLVFDNAEHLVDALARLVRALMEACPRLHVLVTSQAPLRIEGEQVFRLGPLGLPEPDALIADAATAGAVALFVDRVRAADHRFALTSQNLDRVVRVCERLDGLPLAIRLAAARVPLLGLQGLEARLDERLRLLVGDSRDAPTRQQTLLAALDWSHGLLPPREQVLFRRLGAFIGGFGMETVIAVGDDIGGDEWSVIDSLAQLVDRSLVSLDGGDPPRYRLLESARAYALQQLAVHGEAHDAARRHAQALAARLQRAFDRYMETPDEVWLADVAPDLDNVRAALDWSAQHDPGLWVILVGGASGLFRMLEFDVELRHRIEAAPHAATPSGDPDTLTRYWLARAYLCAGVAQRSMHDFAAEAERIARLPGQGRWLFSALTVRAMSGIAPEHEHAALLAEIVRLEPADGPPRLRAQRWGAEFCLHAIAARWSEALTAAETGLALARAGGTLQFRAVFASWVLVALISLNRVDDALRRSIEMQAWVLVGRSSLAISFLGTCARCSLLAGDLATAKQLLTRMFDHCRIASWQNFPSFADLYVQVGLADRRPEASARLLGFAKAARRRVWFDPRSARRQDEMHTALARLLDAQTLADLQAEGEQLDEEAAIALVLGDSA
jgi:predicted ATPase/DNA-binding winged helix-turn-helix (wHTH) protein